MYEETDYPRGYIRLVRDMFQGASTRLKSKRGMMNILRLGLASTNVRHLARSYSSR